jgi:hypothetical protein
MNEVRCTDIREEDREKMAGRWAIGQGSSHRRSLGSTVQNLQDFGHSNTIAIDSRTEWKLSSFVLCHNKAVGRHYLTVLIGDEGSWDVSDNVIDIARETGGWDQFVLEHINALPKVVMAFYVQDDVEECKYGTLLSMLTKQRCLRLQGLWTLSLL